MADSSNRQQAANTQAARTRLLQWSADQIVSLVLSFVVGGCTGAYIASELLGLRQAIQNVADTARQLKEGQATLAEELRSAKKEITRLQLERVGAFPLLFENAGTAGDELSHRGVQLAPGQLATWRRQLFRDSSWPDAAAKNVAHCVVAYSSTARFQGKPKEVSDELNVQAAGCRADSVAKELDTVLDEPTPVASCRWSSYDAMTRPHLQPDGHLATPDRQLISRSAFVHGFRLSEEELPSIQEGGFDVGEECDEWMVEKLGVESSTLSCSTVDGEPPDGNGCPPNAPNPPNPEQEDG